MAWNFVRCIKVEAVGDIFAIAVKMLITLVHSLSSGVPPSGRGTTKPNGKRTLAATYAIGDAKSELASKFHIF